MWTTVLFDLDGTLTDSGEGITRCVQYALRKEFDIRVENLHELDCFVGPPLKEQFMSYAGLNEEDAERAIRAYRERYRTRGIYENRLYDGIPELLAALARRGMLMAVASSKPTEFCREILRYFGIEQYFRVVVGSEMNGERTRKSDVVEEALRQLGMTGMKRQAVLVGDRLYDVEGAKEAGIGSIGVTFGYGSREELENAWPDCIVDNTRELENVLIGQLQDGMSGGERLPLPGGSYGAARPGTPGPCPPRYGDAARDSCYFPPQGYYPYPQQLRNYPPQGYQYPPMESAGGIQGAGLYPGYPEMRPLVQAGGAPCGPGASMEPGYGDSPEQYAFYEAAGRGAFGRQESVPYRIWRIVYPILMDFGLNIVMVNLAMILILALFGGQDPYSIYDRHYILIMGIANLAAIPVWILLLRSDEKRRAAAGQGSRLLKLNSFTIPQVVVIVLYAIGVSALVEILTSFLPIRAGAVYSQLEKSIEVSSPFVKLLVVCIGGPVCEELLYRGLIYRRLRDYMGAGWAVFVSAVIFGCAHGNLYQGVYSALFGLVLALLYEHYGTIYACMTAHIVNNLMASFSTGVMVSWPMAGQLLFEGLCLLTAGVLTWYIFGRHTKVNAA